MLQTTEDVKPEIAARVFQILDAEYAGQVLLPGELLSIAQRAERELATSAVAA